MNPFHHHLHTRSREISLNEAERARMRRVVGAYMRMHPHRASQQRLSPVSVLSMLFSRHALAFVLIGAVLTSSAGVSYAAESALPGDALYAVKTKVTEPLRGAFASSPREKAEWAMQVADERAKEAATLAAEKKLNDEKRRIIGDNFRAHATLAAASIEEAAGGDPIESAQAATRFEARLSEYERVIVALVDTPDTDDSLARTIRAERETFAKVRERAEERVQEKDDDAYRRAAAASLAHAREHISAAREAFASSTEATVVAQLEAASSTIAAHDARTTREEARASVRKTLRDAEKIRAFAETSRAIHSRTGFTIERDETPKRSSKVRAAPPAATPTATITDSAFTRGAAPIPSDTAAMMTAMPAAEAEIAPAIIIPESVPAARDEDRHEEAIEDEYSGRTSDVRERGVILLSVPELDDDEKDED